MRLPPSVIGPPRLRIGQLWDKDNILPSEQLALDLGVVQVLLLTHARQLCSVPSFVCVSTSEAAVLFFCKHTATRWRA